MKIKLNKINKIFIAGFAFLFTLILAGCAGDVDQPLMYSPDNGTYIVNGCISFGENNAALSQRTATSSFSVDGLSWEIRVYKIDEKTDSEAYKTFKADSDGKFSVTLDGKGKYDFMALLMKDEVVCASGHAELTILGPVLDQLKITIKPVEAGEGKINLEVSLDSAAAEKVNNVKVYFMGPVSPETSDDMVKIDFLKKLMSGIYNKTFPVSGGKAQIVYDNFFSGSYLAKLSFDDAAGNTLYSCEQVINVYPGFTTDTWYGSASDGKLTVSNSMINGYGAEIVPNFDKLLLWKHAEWNEGNEMKGDFYYLVDENSIGRFTALTAPTKVVEQEELDAFEAFAQSAKFYSKIGKYSSGFDTTCFDAEGNAYLVRVSDNAPREGSGVVSTKEVWKFVGHSDISLDDGNVIDFTIDLKNNVAYSLKGGDFDVICRYPNMISSNGANTEKEEITLGRGNINSFVVYDGKAYALCKENDYIIRVFDTYDEEPIKPMIKEYSVNLNDFFNDALGTAMITDMLYQDGRLYLLYKEAFSWPSSPTTIGNRGAVIEVNLFDGSVRNTGLTTSALSNTEYKLQGYNNSLMYTDSACTTPYIPSEEILTNANVEYPDICFPNEGEKSFYGPTRFIAVKPKKLVIADEGLAFYTDDELLRYKNVNRVVYVDLENFAVEKIVTLDSSVGLSENETSVLKSESSVSVKELRYYTKNGSDSTSCFYVGITCGDNE
ncbi:MAG: hypothetical protein MSH65_11705 [Spirochaetia bacterium]|nr:hypothetical protein [Spirochaetia bacterium]